MSLRGKIAELMIRVNLDLYQPYIKYPENGVSMLYVHLTKVLHGMLRAAVLFYKRLKIIHTIPVWLTHYLLEHNPQCTSFLTT